MARTAPPFLRRRLLSAGYFPKELPPPFNTIDLSDFDRRFPDYVGDSHDAAGLRTATSRTYETQLVAHKLARPGTNRRILGIPNPMNQVRLVKFIDENFGDLFGLADRSPYSSSKPSVMFKGSRALSPRWTGSTLSHRRAQIRANAQYICQADVLNYYPSIYTHSIPWAMHGKAAAKRDRSSSLVGNTLDKILREAQWGQTVGIPVGPDTSFLVSEIMLGAVDAEVHSKLASPGMRWYVDYEISFTDYGRASEFLVHLESILDNYQLNLSMLKTKISTLPSPFIDSWPATIKNIRLSHSPAKQADDLFHLFNTAFSICTEHPKSGILRYAIKKLYSPLISKQSDRMIVHEFNWSLVQHFLFQVAIAEPNSIPVVLGIISYYKMQGYGVDAEGLECCLLHILSNQADRSLSSDVAWAIWGCIENQIEIPNELARKASMIECDVCSLTLLHARSLNIVSTDADLTAIDELIDESDFQSCHWLLSYESWVKGWVNQEHCAKVSESVHAQALRDENVSFYRTSGVSGGSASNVATGAPLWLLSRDFYN